MTPATPAMPTMDLATRLKERLIITPKDAHKFRNACHFIFDLPGEIRNIIYTYALAQSFQRVPLDTNYRGSRDWSTSLLLTCSTIYHETRSYIAEKQTVYIPVLTGTNWRYGDLVPNYGFTLATKDTIVCSLTDFHNVHFHLHIDPLECSRFDPQKLLKILISALGKFLASSPTLYINRNLEAARRAVIHLDHMLSLWPKILKGANCLTWESIRHLIDFIAQDKLTIWEIRYYLPTGQAGVAVEYGSCELLEDVRDIELSQLRYHANQYDNVFVMAEIYGDDTSWELGDRVGCAVRMRTPATEFWPNVHWDPSEYSIVTYKDFRKVYLGEYYSFRTRR